MARKKNKKKKRTLDKGRKKRSSQSKKLQERIKKGQERSKGRSKNIIQDELDIPIWRPKDGSHIVDVIPYDAGDNDPLVDSGDPTYTYEYWVHTNVGANNSMFLCPTEMFNDSCPICEHRQKLKEDGADDEVWAKLFPKRRNLYNIVCYDRGEADKGVQVWDVSFHYFEKLVMAISKKQDRRGGKPKTVNFADAEDGKSISFTIEPAKSKKDYPKFVGHAFDDRDYEIDEDILEEVKTLDEIVEIPEYDEIDKAYWGDKDKRGKRGKARKSKDKGDEDKDNDELADLIDDLDDCEDLDDMEEFIDEHDLDVKIKRKDDEDDVKEKITEALEEEYGGEPDNGLTEKKINKMKKSQLRQVIEDEELDIDPDDFDDREELAEEVIDELGL
jgi:hypothetical protein